MRNFALYILVATAVIYGEKRAFGQDTSTPDISLIVDFGYLGNSLSDEEKSELYIPGFTEPEEHGAEPTGDHQHGVTNSGFNLNYAELNMASTVDPFFDLVSIFHISETSIEIEEAYVATRFLPNGFQAKGGKFFSSFGRINSQHAHFHNFFDGPVIHDLLFGQEGLLDSGLQLNWVAPTETFIWLGVEAFNGNLPEGAFAKGSFVADIDGDERSIEKSSVPNAFTLLAKSSTDIGSLTILGGASYAFGNYRKVEKEEAVDTTNQIFGLSLLAKYYFSSYSYVTWQSEYLHNKIDGSQYSIVNHTEDKQDGHDEHGTEYNNVSPVTKERAGYYTQLLYHVSKLFSFGGRYEGIVENEERSNARLLNHTTSLNKYSVMAQINFSEFSYVRLQYNRDETRYLDGKAKPLEEVALQFNYIIGAHPAHSF